MQKIVNGYVDETRVCAIEETLNQPNEKAAPTKPFESRQHLHEKLSHVHARWRQQAVKVVQVANDQVTTFIFNISFLLSENQHLTDQCLWSGPCSEVRCSLSFLLGLGSVRPPPCPPCPNMCITIIPAKNNTQTQFCENHSMIFSSTKFSG